MSHASHPLSCRLIAFAVVIVLFSTVVSQAAIITNVTFTNSQNNTAAEAANPNVNLQTGDQIYYDRTDLLYDSIPDFLVGQEFIQLSRLDSLSTNMTIQLTLATPARVYIIADDRGTSWVQADNPSFSLVTGEQVTISGAPIDYDIFVTDVTSAGTFDVDGATGGTTRVAHAIVVTPIPEPGSLLLLGAGVAMIGLRRQSLRMQLNHA